MITVVNKFKKCRTFNRPVIIHAKAIECHRNFLDEIRSSNGKLVHSKENRVHIICKGAHRDMYYKLLALY